MPEAVVPERIGRYEIVGRLAVGGMAEVFLGRLHGPHGFERPVVIKRILPHLAADSNMVDLFLDEARIIANLRHPNLIHVHELGREGNELFIAMEYLAGESLSGVCRRLASRGELLDFDLAAHIIAEACAGLHAAHEATSADRRPLDLVHRDVSPQNIFVSYTGAVHVIDFGIATTVDRVARTEAGTVRGKFEYMAPEQVQSIPVDRRTDVFALGVVLFELVSGRRAYKRESPAATIMAVMNEAAPQIAAFRADVPERLEQICARALAKSRRERFQTAAEMRRALLTFTRQRTDGDLTEVCAQWMHTVFADRIAEKTDMLLRVREGSVCESLPAAEVDVNVELPTAERPGASSMVLSQSIPVLVRSTPRRRALWLPAGILAATIVLGASGWRLSRSARVDTARSPFASSLALPAAAPLVPVTSSVSPAPAPAIESASAETSQPAPGNPTRASSPAASKAPVHRRAATPAAPPPTGASPPKPSPTVW